MRSQLQTTEEWVASLSQEQRDKYTYEFAVYKGTDEDIEITCKEHGNFWQRAYIHKKRGAGCPKCYGPKRGASQRFSNQDFIAAARKVHGNTYNYDLVDYKNQSTKVKIECPTHGYFEQMPNNHLSGKGCTSCYDERRGPMRRSNSEEFIKKAIQIHGGSYSYERVEYVDAFEKVEVFCKEHNGYFKISPTNHLGGNGCSQCKKSGYRTNKPGYCYLLFVDNIIKVGITNRPVSKRVKEICKSSNKNFKELAHVYSEDGQFALDVETACHRYLKSLGVKQVEEVFDGSTECFVDADVGDLFKIFVPFIKFANPELEQSSQ